MTPYIEYLDASNNFEKITVYFFTLTEAIEWGKTNLENFNFDMIKYKKP